MTLQAFTLEIQGTFSAEQTARRGVPFWTKPRTVVAHTEAAAIARARELDPEAEFVVVKGTRPARWSELPLEAFEIHHTKRAAAASADGWKQRGRLARVFPRSVRAGGAETGVIAVVVRRKA